MKKVNKEALGVSDTPSTVNNPAIKTKETNMSTIPHIIAYLNTTQMDLTPRIEAQRYVFKLMELDGVYKKAHYREVCSLAPKDANGHYNCSSFADEGWKRCFDTLQVGVMPMSSGTVRKDWYKPEKEGYPAAKGSGNEYIYHGSKPPMDGYEVDHSFETPLEVMDADCDDSAANHWLSQVEAAGDNTTKRIVALAGGISTNKNWLL